MGTPPGPAVDRQILGRDFKEWAKGSYGDKNDCRFPGLIGVIARASCSWAGGCLGPSFTSTAPSSTSLHHAAPPQTPLICNVLSLKPASLPQFVLFSYTLLKLFSDFSHSSRTLLTRFSSLLLQAYLVCHALQLLRHIAKLNRHRNHGKQTLSEGSVPVGESYQSRPFPPSSG